MIPAEAAHVAVLPSRCGGATPCTGLRVVIVSQNGILTIPDASVLYTCQFKIVDDAAPGSYVLGVTNLGFADERGALLTGATAIDGIVTVADGVRPTPTATPTPDFTTCVGDCDTGGMVTVNELVRAVNFLLEGSAPDGCVAIDRNDNGRVTVDEIVGAINNALCGCNRTCPTPDPTHTPTPQSTFTPTPPRPTATLTATPAPDFTLRARVRSFDSVELDWTVGSNPAGTAAYAVTVCGEDIDSCYPPFHIPLIPFAPNERRAVVSFDGDPLDPLECFRVDALNQSGRSLAFSNVACVTSD